MNKQADIEKVATKVVFVMVAVLFVTFYGG